MDPKHWGYGTWILIFLFIENYKTDLEKLKKVLWIICNNLPCKECSNHIQKQIIDNNILSETDHTRIKVFFIMVYNLFKLDKPDQLIRIDHY